MRRTRNPVYGSFVSRVRIPLSPPSVEKRVLPSCGMAFFYPIECSGMEVLFDILKAHFCYALNSALLIAQTIFTSKRNHSLMNINNDLFELLHRCYLQKLKTLFCLVAKLAVTSLRQNPFEKPRVLRFQAITKRQFLEGKH